MSKRARAAAMKRETARLFAGVDLHGGATPQPSERERDLRQAAELEALAARGMASRKFRKEAVRLRKKWL